jgi:hypothetical protein
MRNTVKQTTTPLRSQSIIKLALLTAICGLGLMSNAFGQPIQLDLGNSSLASNGAGFTKVGLNNYTVVNGTYYEWDNVAGTTYALSITNVNQYGGAGTLDKDGFFNISGTGPAYFTLSGLPAGYTVAIYACCAWDGTGRGGKFEYGGVTNSVTTAGAMASPSISTLQFVGRAVVDVNGKVSGRWYGQGSLTGEGQVGAMILDVEPCQPVLTLTGLNPMVVPINSTFHDPGATAVESCTGSALSVITNGSVDAMTLGTYYVTYSAVADGYSNSVTRTVNVLSSDFVQVDLATSGSTVPTPAGFTKLRQTTGNMSFPVQSLGGSAYILYFTNISAYSGGNASSTLDKDGFYCAANTNVTFAMGGLTPGNVVTLYACWGWDGSGNAAIITYGGAATKLTVGSGITSPSILTLQNVGTAVADGAGRVSGTWANGGSQAQVGGMIFSIATPVGHSITVLPTGVTNNCGASATFIAAGPTGASLQWYNNFNVAITGATNSTLVLTNLHPSDNGNFRIVASGTGWSVTNSVVIDIIDVAPPVMTMSGKSLLVIQLNSTWTDPGVTAWDSCGGSSLTVTTLGSVNTSVLGEYDLTYSAMTAGGIPGSMVRNVIVIDNSIQPDVQLALDFGPTGELYYTPPAGFTKLAWGNLNDNVYGDFSALDPTGIGSSLTFSVHNIGSWDTATYDNHTLSTDGFSNHGNQPATFTLSGVSAGLVVNVYAVYAYGGLAHAPVIIYGGATNLVTAGITTNSPNPPTQADFQFVGSAIATNGVATGTWYGPTGPTAEGQIGGMIINVQSIPAHSLVVAPASSTPQCGTNLTMATTVSGVAPFTYQWYDNHTNLIAGAINATYTLMDVRATSAGNYTVIATDAYGSATNIATITGVTDAAAPVMALNGINPVILAVNKGPYVDAGATAYDLCGEGYVTVGTVNPVDVATVGTYTVTYTATTASGNHGTLTRTVNVVPVPNDTLQLDFAPTSGTVQPAPAGFTKVQNAAALAVGNYIFPALGGSSYTLSITNIGSYNSGNTNEPLVTDGFYSSGPNGPAYFTLSGLPQGMIVTLYAIWAWDGSSKYANVFFGGTNAQIVNNGDPGTSPTLANFTKIGMAVVGSSCAVNGHWQGPGGPNTEGQVGAMVILVADNTPPVANNILMGAVSGLPAALKIIGGASAPTDPDGDPLTVTAVQSPTPHSGTVTTDGINVTYTSSPGFTGQDTFTYTVGDGRGGFATATVTVDVGADGGVFNRLSAPTLAGGLCGMVFQGIPHVTYVLEETPSLSPVAWSTVVTQQAGASGQLNFSFAASPGTDFYRVRALP